MFCSNCGKEIKNESKFCRFCGTAVSAENNNEIYSDNRIRHGFVSFMLIGGAITCSIIGVVYIVLGIVNLGIWGGASYLVAGIYSLIQVGCYCLLIKWRRIGFWLFIGFTPVYLFILPMTGSHQGIGIALNIWTVIASIIGLVILYFILQLRKNGKSTWEQLN